MFGTKVFHARHLDGNVHKMMGYVDGGAVYKNTGSRRRTDSLATLRGHLKNLRAVQRLFESMTCSSRHGTQSRCSGNPCEMSLRIVIFSSADR